MIGMLLPLAGLRAAEWHVAVTGKDTQGGTKDAPLQTIQRAADLAQPGDTVTVHAGVYRERINPPRGGESDAKRIIYQAAPGGKVEIKGSEVVTNWEKVQDDTWKASLPNTFFGKFNPYSDLVHGDWYNKSLTNHTGAVYLNGKWLRETKRLEDVLKPADDNMLWFAQVDDTNTTIWAQFRGINPNERAVEINVRQSVFYPDKRGRNFITVRGFGLMHAATPWAPPTAEQIGLIGTHWSKGWIIENNDIHHSTCVGVTLGKYGDEWDNKGESNEGYYRSIKLARDNGWTKDNIGHHIVRNNIISHCEQAGIVGSLGAVFSEVSGNTIWMSGNVFLKGAKPSKREAALTLDPLGTTCPAQEIAVKNGESIAFMGDSITEQAWDSANGHWGWNSPLGHIHLVMDALDANGIKAAAIPAGMSGHTSRDMRKRLQRDVLEKKPTWLTLSCGVNDVGPWNQDQVLLPEFKTNVTDIVTRAQAAGIKVMLLTATPVYEDAPDNAANRSLVEYNKFLRALAAEKFCLLADLNADLLARRAELIKNTGKQGNQVTSDGVHMNTEGSMVSASGILRIFGFAPAQLVEARSRWMEIPGAVILPGPPQSVSMRQLEQLQKLTEQRRCALDVLVNETCSTAIEGLLRNATPQAAQANMALGKIMPLGDSITKGAPAGAYRDPLFTLLHNAGHTFQFIGTLTENPTAALTAAEQDHHEGHSGMGMEWIDANLANFVRADPPDCILLAIGANDVGGATVPELKARMDKLVTDLYSLLPKVKLYLASVTPQTGQVMTKIHEFNKLIPGIVASHQAKGLQVTYVPMDALKLQDLEDNVHPNVAGSLKMAQAWYAALVKPIIK